VAELALYRCVNREYEVNDKGSRKVTKIEYSYEFLEDYVTPQPTLTNFIQDRFMKKNEQPLQFHAPTILENPFTTQDKALEPFPNVQNSSHLGNNNVNMEEETATDDEQESWWLQENYDTENHPLELMVCMCAYTVTKWRATWAMTFK